jgi:DNA-binding MarR family transcriptional regulator
MIGRFHHLPTWKYHGAVAANPTAVAGLLFRLNTELRRGMQQEIANEPSLAEAGVRAPCVALLKLIDKKGPISQRAISDALLVDPSDLVSVLDVLEDAGYLERRRDPDDRRRNAIVLTAAGKKATDRAIVLARRAEDRILARLTATQRAELGRLIELAIGDE